MEVKHFHAGEHPLEVHMLVTKTASGIIVQLLGGDRPHIGATVVTHPRPSLLSAEQVSCNSIVIPELGHKEDELAKPLAEKIAKKMNSPVVLVAGIHVDKAGTADIEQITRLCRDLVDNFLANSSTG
ncbi:hypothetical protein [Desulfoscipio geothermicus]|uniref:Prenylated flavin chaperone LpdD-like domain-containing protein n=1 Tax=Desulfoscipio geothermicus DSM 3669 TaxID=1121426 RepID=A0A1I6DX49_9FIRM|nr:hypothetical protein [Desulfoscipio geothermicus]SFR10080.1 hypothetical protein SAMN05660706_12031 [Desulfoscipio geothermicus DSM 3669]